MHSFARDLLIPSQPIAPGSEDGKEATIFKIVSSYFMKIYSNLWASLQSHLPELNFVNNFGLVDCGKNFSNLYFYRTSEIHAKSEIHLVSHRIGTSMRSRPRMSGTPRGRKPKMTWDPRSIPAGLKDDVKSKCSIERNNVGH